MAFWLPNAVPSQWSFFPSYTKKVVFDIFSNFPKVFLDVEGMGWENPENVHGFGTFSGSWRYKNMKD